MANPQPTDPHLRVAHELIEELLSCDFSKRQLSIILLILRLSWGCTKKWATLPMQRDFEVAGVLDTHVKKELQWLSDAKVLIIDGDRFWFNKNYDSWRVSRVHCHSRERLTELVSLNILDSYQNGKTKTPEKDQKVTETVSPSGVTQAPLKKDNSITVDIHEDIKTIIMVWEGVTGFKLAREVSAKLATQLKEDYPELDILDESKGWAAYCMDYPLRKGSSPAQQLRNRMKKAREFQLERRQNGKRKPGANRKRSQALRARDAYTDPSEL